MHLYLKSRCFFPLPRHYQSALVILGNWIMTYVHLGRIAFWMIWALVFNSLRNSSSTLNTLNEKDRFYIISIIIYVPNIAYFSVLI